MKRIVLARSGSYYVQRWTGWRWLQVGPFFPSKRSARAYAEALGGVPNPYSTSRVVEYL